VLLLIAGALFGAVGWRERRTRYLAAAGIALGLILVIWGLSRLIVTDRQQLEINIRAMAAAVVDGNKDVFLKHLAKDFAFEGMDRQALAAYVASRARAIDHVRIWRFEVEKLDRHKGTAQALFGVTVNGDFMIRFRVQFVLEGEHWRLQKPASINPFADQPMKLPGF
jgi:hypothetical protein